MFGRHFVKLYHRMLAQLLCPPRPRRRPVPRVALQLEGLEDRTLLSAALTFTGPFASWTNLQTAYGAKGDGVTDDTAAFQQALNDLGTPGHSNTLYIPAGTYVITSTITLGNKEGVNVIGADPANTIIQWKGPTGTSTAPTEMFDMWGTDRSVIDRITLNGNNGSGTATIGLGVYFLDPTLTIQGHFPEENEYSDDVFENLGYGLQPGSYNNGKVGAGAIGRGQANDGVADRDQFINCSVAGVDVGSQNSYGWSISNSTFQNDNYGVTNAFDPLMNALSGGGMFYVYNSNFFGSWTSDLNFAGAGFFSFRNNYSNGSAQFFHGGGGSDPYPTVIQDNTIANTTSTTKAPIELVASGPWEIIDNTIVNPAYTGTTIKGPGGFADILSVGNTFAVPGNTNNHISLPGGGRLIETEDTNSTNFTAPPAPTLPPTPTIPADQMVFEPTAFTGAAIQTAINSAVAAVEAGITKHAVVHLPQGSYSIASTIMVPANVDLTIVGDGDLNEGTVLSWTGMKGGTVLDLQGPSRANLRGFYVSSGPNTDGVTGILVENTDQANDRLFLDETAVTGTSQDGVLVDGLDNAKVKLQDFYDSNNTGTSLNVVGGAAPNGGGADLFNGDGGSTGLAFNVSNGAQLLVEDFFNEVSSSNHQFVNLTGSGDFTLQGAREDISVDTTTNANGQYTDPPVNINNGFTGNATILDTYIEGGVGVQPGATGNVLTAESVNYEYLPTNNAIGLNNYSTAAQVAFVGNELRNNALGIKTQPIANALSNVPDPNQDPSFLLSMLAQVRSEQPDGQPFQWLAPGLTDLGFYRIAVSGGAIGIRIKGQTSTNLITGETLGSLANNVTGYLGASITVGSSNIAVTSLGRWVVSGNTGTHTLKLVDASTGIDVPGSSVTVNTSGAPAGQFLYAALASPVILGAGHTYYLVSSETNGGDWWYGSQTTVTTRPGISVNSAIYNPNGVWTPKATAGHEIGPVDLQYYLTTSSTRLTTQATLGAQANNFTGDVGAELTVGASDIAVTSLGRWVVSGNTGTHTLELVDQSTGNAVPNSSVTVNTSGAVAGQFLYAALPSPVVLSAGHTYYLVSSETAGGDWWGGSQTTVLTTSAVSVINGIYNPNGVWTTKGGAGHEIGPVDLQYAIPQIVAGGPPLLDSPASALSQDELAPSVDQAIQAWEAAGMSPDQVALLRNVHFVIASLPQGIVGETTGLGAAAGNTIYLDPTAAGFGWSLGATVTPGRVDLETVVAHELGHILGLPDVTVDTRYGGIMDTQLPLGVQRLPVSAVGKENTVEESAAHVPSTDPVGAFTTPALRSELGSPSLGESASASILSARSEEDEGADTAAGRATEEATLVRMIAPHGTSPSDSSVLSIPPTSLAPAGLVPSGQTSTLLPSGTPGSRGSDSNESAMPGAPSDPSTDGEEEMTVPLGVLPSREVTGGLPADAEPLPLADIPEEDVGGTRVVGAVPGADEGQTHSMFARRKVSEVSATQREEIVDAYFATLPEGDPARQLGLVLLLAGGAACTWERETRRAEQRSLSIQSS